MQVSFSDTIPRMKAGSIQAGVHVADAGVAARDIARAQNGTDRALAAARVVDELDHAVDAMADVPGSKYIPHATHAFGAYDLASTIVRATAGTRVAGKAHPVLGAAELLAARDHMGDAVALHGAPNASHVDRLRAATLLDAAVSDAQSGFAFLDHPAVEGRVVTAIQAAKVNVEARTPIDPTAVATTQQLLQQAADTALGRSTPVAATAAPVLAPAAPSPAAPSFTPAPHAVASTYAATKVAREVRLDLPTFDLPELVLPPVPSFS